MLSIIFESLFVVDCSPAECQADGMEIAYKDRPSSPATGPLFRSQPGSTPVSPLATQTSSAEFRLRRHLQPLSISVRDSLGHRPTIRLIETESVNTTPLIAG